MKHIIFFIGFSLLFFFNTSDAQIRTKIDEERRGVDYFDNKGFELATKFKKWDKTYYVGYMYEGAYKFNRASDYLGYKNAIPPLEEARLKLEKDYNYKLKTRSSDFMVFIGNYQYQLDYSWICFYLYECYSNIEQSDKAMEVLQRLASKRFQKDLFCRPYINMSWTVHRNRYHTSKKYSFLKNTIEENESLALKYLDSSFAQVEKNYSLNSRIYNPGHEQYDFWNIYFNKSLIYSYNFEMDSAEYYYSLLKGTPFFSENNYAYTKLMNGEFKEAIHYFTIEKNRDDLSEKRTKEFYYMLGLLQIYKAKPELGIKDLQDIISKQGSSPGFGWNNLGLARGYYYNGQLAESQKYLDKASSFEEMHIGTTWAPEHYDFTTTIFSYLNKDRKLESIPFENKGYWYNFPALLKMSKYFIEEQSEKFMLINKFGANPERDYVYYHLFSPENTITFDEIWKIIDGLDADFFIKKFTTYLKEDSRENVKRYYKYFIARLLINKGDYTNAETLLNEVLNDENLDIEHEKLLKARCYEALCIVYKELDIPKEYQSTLLSFYSTYPQLVPFSNHKMTFNLSITSTLSKIEENEILEELNNCNITILSKENFNAAFPIASIKLSQIDSVRQIECHVLDTEGQTISQLDAFKVEEVKGSGKRLAYYLFNIPATEVQEYGDNNYWLLFGVLACILLLYIAHLAKKSLKF